MAGAVTAKPFHALAEWMEWFSRLMARAVRRLTARPKVSYGHILGDLQRTELRFCDDVVLLWF